MVSNLLKVWIRKASGRNGILSTFQPREASTIKPGFHWANYDHDNDQFRAKTKRSPWRMTAQTLLSLCFCVAVVAFAVWWKPCLITSLLRSICLVWIEICFTWSEHIRELPNWKSAICFYLTFPKIMLILSNCLPPPPFAVLHVPQVSYKFDNVRESIQINLEKDYYTFINCTPMGLSPLISLSKCHSVIVQGRISPYNFLVPCSEG